MNDGANLGAEFWQWLKSETVAILVSGLAGGAVRAVALRENKTRAAISIAMGGLCAEFLAQDAAAYSPIKISMTTAGFLIGIAGIAIAGFVFDVIRFYRAKVGGGRP